jgi:hypothetical protein
VAVDFDRWLAGYLTLKDSTRREHESIGALYIKPGIGYLHPEELREHHIEDLYAAMRQIGRVAPGSRPTPTLRLLLEARTNTPQARRPLSRARIRRVHMGPARLSRRSTATRDRRSESGIQRPAGVKSTPTASGLDARARRPLAADGQASRAVDGVDTRAGRCVPRRRRR